VSDPGANADVAPMRSPERDPWLRFALGFGALALLSELVYYAFALESNAMQAYLEALAGISGAILSHFTDGIQVRGTLISGALFSVEIAQGCDAYRICALLAAAMLAFPATWFQKAVGLVAGLTVLNALNFVRICGLYFVGGLWYPEFHRAHIVYFPIFLIAMTVAVWIAWVRWVTRDDAGPAAPSA
jgi:exosortase/archaeosortase family protein